MRGGGGANIAALASLEADYRAAESERNRAAREVEAVLRGVRRKGGDTDALRKSLSAMFGLDEAEERLRALSLEQVNAFTGAGSQVGDRLEEELARQRDRQNKEAEREWKKHETRPNYDSWKRGKDVQDRARSTRGGANDTLAEAGRLEGKVEAWRLLDAKINAKEAKAFAKEAKKAAKKAKDAAKYGTKKEAEAAAHEAERIAKEAEKKAAEASDQLLEARVEAEKKRRGEGAEGESGSDGKAPPDGPGKPTPVAHKSMAFPECGGIDPMTVCLDNCPEGCADGGGRDGYCVCTWAKGARIGGPIVVPKGVKGKGFPQAPPDSTGSTPDGAPSALDSPSPDPAVSPDASPDEAGLTTQEEDTDSQGNVYVAIDEENIRYFQATGAVAIKHFGEWLLLPRGVVRTLVRPGSDPPFIDMALFEDAALDAARTRVMQAWDMDSLGGSKEKFDREFHNELMSERAKILAPLRVEESDLGTSVRLGEALKATGLGAVEFAKVAWNVAAFVPGLETIVDVGDLVAGIVRGDGAQAALAAAGLALPLSGRAARLLTEAIVEGVTAARGGVRIIDLAPGSDLRKRLEEGLKKGIVELPEGLALDQVQAHHVLPRRFRNELAELGIDAERFAAWWETGQHQALKFKYNLEMRETLRRVKEITSADVKMRELSRFIHAQSDKYKLTVYFLAGDR
jgi:hypothetical protein